MIYPSVSIAEGRLALEALKCHESYMPHVEWIGQGNSRFDTELVDDLADELQALRRELGEPAGNPPGYFARFEGRAARLVHAVLELPPATAVDHEFWIWLVFGSQHDYLAKLVTWRHGKNGGDFEGDVANYGLSTNLENGFFSRMWLRADLAFDETRQDPYALSLRGDQDFWRSHLLRTEYGQVPNVVRALILFQYPDEAPFTPTVSTQVMRQMAKELRRRQATSAYELLTLEEAHELVKAVHGAVQTR